MQINDLADIIIICGHYGCGKTNLALNMAADFARKGERVTLVDLDIVNPYFRSSDYAEFIEKHGIELIAPTFAHSNLDLPSLPTEMYSIFTRAGRKIIDLGGDDAGATALGRFAPKLRETDYSMLYVMNQYRVQSSTVEQTCELLREIEQASRLKAGWLVNNSHLMEYTSADTVKASLPFAEQVSAASGLPIAFTTLPKALSCELAAEGNGIYPVDIIVKKPWEMAADAESQQ